MEFFDHIIDKFNNWIKIMLISRKLYIKKNQTQKTIS
jgi:hypothetical protein